MFFQAPRICTGYRCWSHGTCLLLLLSLSLQLQALCPLLADESAKTSQAKARATNFDRSRLVAWCIVPFDAAKRNPAQRANMVTEMGIRRVAYDWRAEHVDSFEDEILQYKQHGIEYFAFWSWHPAMEPLIRKHNIHPQIWMMFGAPEQGTHEEKVRAAAQSLLPHVEKCKELNLSLGLYNHGGWSGEPENMVAVCQYLKEHYDAEHVGIVYNLHHGHEHIEDFTSQLELMKPFLLCLNLNGMNEKANPKILPIGDGRHETEMIRTIQLSGYQGPIGILDHRPEMDTREALKLNLDGLKATLKTIGDKTAAATYEE
ncbi:MAG: hypothetical protein R3C20_22550 [Planctomycetaceae bacterium]